ncbi:hypothetical protein P691DRAFT_807160 [Macrolepiota fuliginosa MF-IS2]|uniref:Uncharacterized protein n=1 Tax=Macrolepiota fuliginosa MF-IS2 TaxID=1400762 RepID=A0A9P5X7I5_9AGAR|nr:hypothetical protein P691DRAFT_807160 [Macrolepiota fuliginosa MF-IS2]
MNRQPTPRIGSGGPLRKYPQPWEMCCLSGTRISTTLSHQLYEFSYNLLSEMEDSAAP